MSGRVRGAWLLLLALPLPALAGGEPVVEVVPWTEGEFVAGALVAAAPVNAATFPFTLDGCHRSLLVDLLYDPAETGAAVPGVGEAALLHTFRLELMRGSAVIATREVRSPAYGHALGVAPAGDATLRVVLTQGAAVSWQLRVRAWELPMEPACFPRVVLSEVEQNPDGPDAGAEWVELWNLDAEDADVSGWTITGTHGERVESTIPDGTLVPAGGRVVVLLPVQTLDNVDEVVELRSLGILLDASPVLRDEADDARSWHRGEPWSFAASSPGG